MDPKLRKLYNRLKKKGLSPEQEQKILHELQAAPVHGPAAGDRAASPPPFHDPRTIYQHNDFATLHAMTTMQATYITRVRSLDDLLDRDNQREADGFPRKIRVGRLIKPGQSGKDKVVVVPSTVEEKFIHDPRFDEEAEEEGESEGGAGEGDEGDVIGEQPVRPSDESGEGPGQGEGGAHEVESNAYDLGKALTEKFQLPNLKDKGKKRSFTRYTYDLTDRNPGFGQFLDKKATLRQIVETNITLGNLPDVNEIDPTRFLISPSDMIYRILSREKDYESQAMIFFLRDYSGSMGGKPTELVVTQHVLIYSWLLYQYARQVKSRYILHDTEAKEVSDFYTYYNSKVAGGTQVSSAYRLVNEIVEKENLLRDYNIYIFHGTDGDDWDEKGEEAIPELARMLTYANRVGVTIAENAYGTTGSTVVEKYLKKSGLLKEKPNLLRMDVLQGDADEPRLIEGIKKLTSE